MLVLTRGAMESIQIGLDIVVTILEIRGNKVLIGVETPGQVRIYRTELLGGQHAPDCPAAVRHKDDQLFAPGTFACTCGAEGKP